MKSVSQSIPGIPSFRFLLENFTENPTFLETKIASKGVCSSFAVLAVRFEVWAQSRAHIIEWIVSNQPWCAQFITMQGRRGLKTCPRRFPVRQKGAHSLLEFPHGSIPTALVETEMIDLDPMLFWYSSCAWTRCEHDALNSFASTSMGLSTFVIFTSRCQPSACAWQQLTQKCSQNGCSYQDERPFYLWPSMRCQFWS